MSVPKFAKIPEGYIEDADRYLLMPIDTQRAIDIGGRFMFKQIVLEQMRLENIIATSGVGQEFCMIIVAYTHKEVWEMIERAKKTVGDMVDKNGGLDGKN